jgi:hypothetical protein
MPPRTPVNDISDGGFRYAESMRYRELRDAALGVEISDRADLALGKSLCVPSSTVKESHSNDVLPVCLVGIPPKIRKAVVERIGIIMATLHSVWAWPDESFENEAMNITRDFLPLTAEVKKVSASGKRWVHRRPLLAELIYGPSDLATEHPPIVRDGVSRPSVDVLDADTRNLWQRRYTRSGHRNLLCSTALGMEAVHAVSVPLPVYPNWRFT